MVHWTLICYRFLYFKKCEFIMIRSLSNLIYTTNNNNNYRYIVIGFMIIMMMIIIRYNFGFTCTVLFISILISQSCEFFSFIFLFYQMFQFWHYLHFIFKRGCFWLRRPIPKIPVRKYLFILEFISSHLRVKRLPLFCMCLSVDPFWVEVGQMDSL